MEKKISRFYSVLPSLPSPPPPPHGFPHSMPERKEEKTKE
jgi:hypothetical protein